MGKHELLPMGRFLFAPVPRQAVPSSLQRRLRSCTAFRSSSGSASGQSSSGTTGHFAASRIRRTCSCVGFCPFFNSRVTIIVHPPFHSCSQSGRYDPDPLFSFGINDKQYVFHQSDDIIPIFLFAMRGIIKLDIILIVETRIASSKSIPCFFTFAAFFSSSHSNTSSLLSGNETTL